MKGRIRADIVGKMGIGTILAPDIWDEEQILKGSRYPRWIMEYGRPAAIVFESLEQVNRIGGNFGFEPSR